MTSDIVIQYIISGLIYGSIYAVIALGFNIVYNATGIINFAQGEFVMLGGMITHSFSKSMSLPLALILAVLLTSLVGGIIEIAFIRNIGRLAKKKMKSPPEMQMTIMTIGLSILLREIALTIWGEQVHTVPFFTGSETSSLTLAGASFSPQLLWIIGTAFIIFVFLSFFYKFTLKGQAMRACACSKTGALICGIPAGLMITFSFILAAGIGALAGAVTAPLTQTHYAIGTALSIKGFTVAVFGGLGSAGAAAAAGFLLGIIESFSIIVFPEAFKDIVSIILLLVILFLRPSGLFSTPLRKKKKEPSL